MEIQYPGEDNFNQQKDQLLALFRRFLLPALAGLAALWLSTGFYIIGPGEVGVIRRFGKDIGRTNPGLHYRLPWPIDQLDIVNLERVRRAEMGFRSFQAGVGTSVQRTPEEALMLTGDENIVEAQLIVQYQIKDPSFYLFEVYQPDAILRTSAEVAMRSVVGGMTIDELLTTGRENFQNQTREFLQKLLDAYQTGLRVTEVRLQVADPPEQVKDAFHEVVRAREDRERLINQAEGYREDLIPKARGTAQQIIREAEAFKEERVLKAQGDAARFVSLYEEYAKAKDVTRTRLYLESIERVLPKVKKTVIDPAATQNASGVLPLGKLHLKQDSSS